MKRSVANQKPRAFPKRRRFAELLGNPVITRRARDAEMNHTSRTQLDHKENEDRSEEQVIRLQKVTSPYLVRVIGQKCRPRLALAFGRQTTPRLAHILLHRPFADLASQLAQLITDPRCSPQPVLNRHLFDQGNRLWRNPRSACFALRFASPEQSKKS